MAIGRWAEWSVGAAGRPWPVWLALGCVLLSGWLLLRWALVKGRQASWERARREELEAYCWLEVTLPLGAPPRKLTDRAKRVCRLVSEKSVFARTALFLCGADGRFFCAGSCGLDDLTLEALEEWSTRVQKEDHAGAGMSSEQMDAELRRSIQVVLGVREGFEGMRGCGCNAATLVPLRMHRSRLVGLLAVCAPRQLSKDEDWMREAVRPLELLAAKLARTLERSMLMERLIEVERLAGAGHLVVGVAEELKLPLNAVRDCSELIAGTASDARVREHAAHIAAQAEVMREVVGTLRDIWRPRDDVGQPL